MMNTKHLGSDFDDFLAEEGLLDEAEAVATKRVLAFQIAEAMCESKLSKSAMVQDPSRRRLAGSIITLLLAVLLLLPVQTSQATICVAQPGQVRYVRGIVVVYAPDSSWEIDGPLPGAVVHLQRGKFEAVTVTDDDGYFAFSRLPQGDYELTAELDGFLTATGTVRVRDSASSGSVLIVDLPIAFEGCGGIEVNSWKAARKLQDEVKTKHRSESRANSRRYRKRRGGERKPGMESLSSQR